MQALCDIVVPHLPVVSFRNGTDQASIMIFIASRPRCSKLLCRVRTLDLQCLHTSCTNNRIENLNGHGLSVRIERHTYIGIQHRDPCLIWTLEL